MVLSIWNPLPRRERPYAHCPCDNSCDVSATRRMRSRRSSMETQLLSCDCPIFFYASCVPCIFPCQIDVQYSCTDFAMISLIIWHFICMYVFYFTTPWSPKIVWPKVKLKFAGRCRLIGVNTPETVSPKQKEGAPPDCYGPEASALTKSLWLDGRSI